MANGDGQNFGSVLTKSLAGGLQGLQQGLQQKRQNDLQNLMTALKVQDAEMNREAFIQNQKLNDLKIQESHLRMSTGQAQLAELLKSDAEKAKDKADALAVERERFALSNLPQDMPGLNILQGVGPEFNTVPFNPQDINQIGFEALNRIRPMLPAGTSLDTPFGELSVPREDQLALAGLREAKTETEGVKREEIIAKIDVLSQKIQNMSTDEMLTQANIAKTEAQIDKIKNDIEVSQTLTPVEKDLRLARIKSLEQNIELSKERALTESTKRELNLARAKHIASGAMSAKERAASERRARTEAGKQLLNEANKLFRESFTEDVFKDMNIGGINTEEDLSRLIVYLNETGGTVNKRFSLIPDEKKPALIKQFSDYFDKLQSIDAGETSPGVSSIVSVDSLPESIDFNGSIDQLIDSLGVQ